jgi:hypothetical protein
MERKAFGVLFALVLVVSLSMVTAVPVGANGTVININTADTFSTIQAAIDDSDTLDGHTIEVGSGTYYEHVKVKKELTIRAASSPIVDGGGSGACFGIYNSAELSNVSIEGFEIRNAKFGIWIYGAGASLTTYDNIALSNNYVHDHSENGILTTDATINGLTISGNTINNSGIGISFDRAIVDGLTVDGNEITSSNVGLAFFNGSYSNVAVSNCYFEGNAWEHIDLGAWDNWPSFSGVNINTCQFLSGPWCAVWVESNFRDYDVVLRYNVFDVGYCGICNTSTDIVDAELNWWGHVSGPYDDKNLDGLNLENTGGLGDIVGGTLWCGDVDYVDYEPWLGQGGWVTGGGWIDSPPGAYMPGPMDISGNTATMEYGGYTGCMARYLSKVCDPNSSPVTFAGSVDVTDLQDNGAVFIGLVDKKWVDEGNTGWMGGAYTYFGRRGDNLIVGPTDGNLGGEIVQTFVTLTDYFDPLVYPEGPPLVTFETTIHAGSIEVSLSSGTWTDDYGVVKDLNSTDAYPWNEFQYGAYVGVDSWPSTNSVLFDVTVSGCQCELAGKASFGFVAKYKKGADVPDGQTEFVFRAADLNFHSSSYDWLVVTGSNYAKFKGTGTINGEGAYQFQLWAGDDEPDTYRIKIWEEDGSGKETVIYDNGMNQAIGGGSIVVHTK